MGLKIKRFIAVGLGDEGVILYIELGCDLSLRVI